MDPAGRVVLLTRFVVVAMTLVLAGTVALPGTAAAHQPRLVGAATRVRVSDPEISKAYYARLAGRPARYVIRSPAPFTLYAQITVPDVAGAHRDWRLTVRRGAAVLATLRTPAPRWKTFYEPFGGDHYLTGAEFRRRVPGGDYSVQVSRPGDRGVYVLAIGEAERFGPASGLRALLDLPRIKHDYFGQSWPRALITRSVPVTLIAVLALCGLIWIGAAAARRVRRR